MRRLLLLALLVPLVAACGSHATSQGGPEVPRWVQLEQLPEQAVPGARVFAAAGCTACHTYAGSGHTVLNGPDLTAIGRRHLGVGFQIAHLKCPACVIPGSPMPPSMSLGAAKLHQLAVFLEASKGTH